MACCNYVTSFEMVNCFILQHTHLAYVLLIFSNIVKDTMREMRKLLIPFKDEMLVEDSKHTSKTKTLFVWSRCVAFLPCTLYPQPCEFHQPIAPVCGTKSLMRLPKAPIKDNFLVSCRKWN